MQTIHTAAPDGAITLRIETARIDAPDELRAVAAWAEAWGLELAGLRAALRRAGVPTVRVGRQDCCRRSDVLRIVDRLASAAPQAANDSPEASYTALVARSRRAAR